MKVSNYKDGKMIQLSKALDTRAKILNLIYFFSFLFAALCFYLMVRNDGASPAAYVFFAFPFCGIYIYIGYKFLNKACESESLFINKFMLTISRNSILSGPENSYDISLISNFRHVDKPETAKHELAGDSFDYLGFETERKVINELHGDNRLTFDYNGKKISFGENVYSWDFDELEVLLYDITGNDFRYTDEFEKTFTKDKNNYSLDN